MSLRPTVSPPRCDVSLAQLTAALRERLPLPGTVITEAETVTSLLAKSPAVVSGVDSIGWLVWILVGLPMFAEGELPGIRPATDQIRHLLAALAMTRTHGNFTRAAEKLRTSRRLVRDSLDQAGLYPWPGLPSKP